MKIASVAEIKSKFSAFLKASEGGPVVVTRNGRPVAVIVGVQDEDEIERLLMAYSPHLQAILDRSRQQFREGNWLGEEEFWSQFEHAKPSKGSAKPKKKPAEQDAAPDRGGTKRVRGTSSHQPPRQVS
jgi:prevent-host-death family protein